MHKISISYEDAKPMIDMYNSCKNIKIVAQSFGYCPATMSRILRENGVLTKKNNKIHCDEDFFKIIDTEKKAYWLGFLYADGYISTRKIGQDVFGICLKSDDIEHISKFKHDIHANTNIHTYIGSGYNSTGEYSRILIASQKSVDYLKKDGVIEHKTLKLKFPSSLIVPPYLLRHFIRGYLDGDGSISYYINSYNKRAYTIGFVGTSDMITGIANYFGKPNLRQTIKNNAYQINIGGNIQVKNILTELYANATVYLTRKYERYIELLKYTER